MSTSERTSSKFRALVQDAFGVWHFVGPICSSREDALQYAPTVVTVE